MKLILLSSKLHITKNLIRILLLILLCSALPFQETARGTELIGICDYVSLALRQSDISLNLKDTLATSNINVALVTQQFRPKLVPLLDFGVTSGNSNQTIGAEIQKTFEIGPNITVGFTSNRVKSEDFVITNSHNTKAYIQILQPLFRKWGQKYSRLNLTRAEMLQRKQTLLARWTQQEIIQNAIQKYYLVVLSRLQKEIAKKALKRSSQYLDVAKSRQSVGLVSKTDVYRAELANLKAETTFLDQRRSQKTAEDALIENISWNSTQDLTLNDNIMLIIPVLPECWQDILPEQRADWQAQLIELELSELSSFRAKRGFLPDVSLSVQVEQKGQGSSIEESIHLVDTDWSVQLRLNSTLEQYREKAAFTKAQISESKSQRDLKTLERHIFREVRQAFETLLSEEKRLIISRKSRNHAEKALELALIRYERGLSDNVELLDSEATFAATEMEIIQNRVAYNLSAVRLAHALGVLNIEWLRTSLPQSNAEQVLKSSNIH